MTEKRQTAGPIEGEVLSPGVVKGCLVLLTAGARPIRSVSAGEAAREVEQFHARIAVLVDRLDRDIRQLRRDGLTAEAQIVETYLFLLRDRTFQQKVEHLIRGNEVAADAAVEKVLGEMIERLERSGNALLAERSAGVRGTIRALQEQWDQEESALFATLRQMHSPVLAMPELLPPLVLEARRSGLDGFVVERGTSLSHAAILAKSFGIPVLRIDSLARLRKADRQMVLMDAVQGRLFIEPTPREEATVRAEVREESETQAEESPVQIWINIVDPSQLTEELSASVAGVGLYRTEMLFMQARREFPDEQHQLEVYQRLFERKPEMPITFRTLDIGGDKNLPYFSLGPQDNPYLGLRAHRIYRYHPEIFITQIRALLQAARQAGHLRILYPMIETVEELSFVQGLLHEALTSLDAQGREYLHHFEQGIMVEVPSAVWDFERLVEGVDFASVGTNDLLQYFFAADRSNANARESYQPLHPAALRMLGSLVEAAGRTGKPLSLCGEIASDLRLLPLLVGLGFRDLSVDVYAVAGIRKRLAELDVQNCQRLAQRSLKAHTAAEVREVLHSFYPAGSVSPPQARGEYVDPVCGMVVDPEETPFLMTRGPERVYFCSHQCRDEYLSRESVSVKGVLRSRE
jgi:phosphoenolpyruvate-protein phosphotransferase